MLARRSFGTSARPARALLVAAPAALMLASTGLVAVADPEPASGAKTDPTVQFPSHNMKLLSWVPLEQFPNDNNAGNDCWGYVSPTGREIAIMGLEKGFGFVDISDPAKPVIIGYVEGPSSVWHDIKIVGQYGYGVSEGGAGIQVVDLSRVDEGIVRHVQNKTQAGHSTTHNIAVNTDTGYLYLAGANIANGGLVAVSTEVPEDPTVVGAWPDMYVHDAQIVSYHEGPYAGREIAFCCAGFGNGAGSTGLRIVDVTDKTNMHTIGSCTWSDNAYSHQGWLSECRRYFYANDELDESTHNFTTRTRMMDVTDLENPKVIGWVSSGADAIDHNLYIHKGLMYQANYRSGLRVFDMADPARPVHIAYFDTYPEADTLEFNGAWSTYPFFPSGNILISDIERGLFVVKLDVTGEPVPMREGVEAFGVDGPGGSSN